LVLEAQLTPLQSLALRTMSVSSLSVGDGLSEVGLTYRLRAAPAEAGAPTPGPVRVVGLSRNPGRCGAGVLRTSARGERGVLCTARQGSVKIEARTSGPHLFSRDSFWFARSVAGALGRSRASRSGLLSWGWSKIAPPPSPACVRPLPGIRRPPSARRCRAPRAFRPCRSRRLRRFAPNTSPQVSCNLHRSWGSPRFCLFPGSLEPFPRRPLWRQALRSFSLCSSHQASPPGLAPSPLHAVPTPVPDVSPRPSRSPSPRARPRGLAPLQKPLHHAVLPLRSARCSPGLSISIR
jgi:hypothetical protein